MDNVLKDEYKDWIIELKKKVRISQLKAAVILNSALIEFYWDLGKIISNKIKEAAWGDKILEQISKDLKDEFPQMKGFSVSNLKVCKLFYNYFQISSQPVNQIDEKFVMQEVTKIPWGHIKVIITKLKDKNIAAFYILKTRENNWSRDVLALQIKSNLFERTGGSVSNFKNTLPDPYSDLAQQTLKDPYVFDFLTLSEGFKERDYEFALRDINKPIGISEFELTEILPENLKSSLPTIEELEQNIFINE
jgi:predicted nuclease of restriction endonuclease-like (RecB) superfamily